MIIPCFITNQDTGVEFSVSDYEAHLNEQVKAGNLEQQMANYLLGKGFGITFNTMTYEQLEEFEYGVQNLNDFRANQSIKYADNFENYISSQYSQIGNVGEDLGELHD